jgi:hypothetical protein
MEDNKAAKAADQPNWILQNLGFVSTAIVSSLFLLSVMTVAQGSTQTALGIITAAGPAAVVMGTLLRIADLLPAVALTLCLVYRGDFQINWLVGLALAVLLSVLTYIFSPIAFIGFMVLIIPMWFFIRQIAVFHPQVMTVRASAGFFAAMLVSSVFLTVLLSGAVSFPLESVELDNGERITAYVLGEQGEWTTVLVKANHALRRVKSDRFASRQVCTTTGSAESGWEKTPAEIIGKSKPPRYEKCPPPNPPSK